MKRILIAILLTALTIAFASTLKYLKFSYTNVLTGSELQENLVVDGEINKSLIIRAVRNHPSKVEPETGFPLNDFSDYSEEYFIFGDGSVFSDRFYKGPAFDHVESTGYKFNSTWDWSGEKYVTRFAKFNISDPELEDLVIELSEIEVPLVPGEVIDGINFRAEVQIKLYNKKGRLYETVSTGIADEKVLAIINSFIDKLVNIESQYEKVKFHKGITAELDYKLETAGIKYHEVSDLPYEKTYNNYYDAWVAHGLEIPNEWKDEDPPSENN